VAPALAHLPRRWKLLLAYLLTDEAYAAAIARVLAEPRPAHAHWTLFGAGFALWAGWQVSTLAGVLVGARLPAGLPLDFALPLTFIAIVVPLIDGRRAAVVALLAGGLAVALAGMPYKLGLFAAVLGGIALGSVLAARGVR
jgi:predicted branched-subunit amino acid permease